MSAMASPLDVLRDHLRSEYNHQPESLLDGADPVGWRGIALIDLHGYDDQLDGELVLERVPAAWERPIPAMPTVVDTQPSLHLRTAMYRPAGAYVHMRIDFDRALAMGFDQALVRRHVNTTGQVAVLYTVLRRAS